MDIYALIKIVIQMTIIIGIGMMVSRKLTLTHDIKQFVTFILINIAIPCLIVNGIFQLDAGETFIRDAVTLFLLSVSITVVGILVGYSFARLFQVKGQRKWHLGILSGLGNTGLIGIPLCALLFGAKGAFFAAVIDTGMALVLYSLAVMLIQNKRRWAWDSVKSVVNMPMLSLIVGSMFLFLDTNPPLFIVELTGSISSIATPLAMIYIGMLVHVVLKDKCLKINRTLLIPVATKLLFVPLLGFLIISLISLDGSIATIFLLQTAMPTITTASIIFAKYSLKPNVEIENLAAMVTVVSTLLSVLSIPLIMYVFRLLASYFDMNLFV